MRVRRLAFVLLPLSLIGLSALQSSAERGSDPCASASLSLAIRPLKPLRPPGESTSVTPHTTVLIAVDATDPRPRHCNSRTLLFHGRQPRGLGFEVFPAPTVAVSTPGSTSRTIVAVTATGEASPGDHRIPLTIRGWGTPNPVAELPIRVEPAPACSVDPLRELFIHAPSVVDDPVRTSFDAAQAHGGAWTFGRLMEQASPEPAKAPGMVRGFFEAWLRDQHINDFSVPARAAVKRLVLDPWPKRTDGQLDLRRAPLRLLAIVARLDLSDADAGHAGELRFVFGLLSPGGHPSQFTLILEYLIPASSEETELVWARRFHELGGMPFPSEAYNARLQRLTDAVTAAGVSPGRVNGSALSTVRTNENMLGKMWELRQFRLSPTTGMLVETTIDRTPDPSFRNDELVAEFINRNEAAILKEDHVVPERFMGQSFRAAASVNMFPRWKVAGINSPEAQRLFSLNTCDGCHGNAVTGTDFVHVRPRKAGESSRLSGFLLGIALEDRTTGALHTYNELHRRKRYVERLVCDCGGRDPCPEPPPMKRRDH